MSEFFKAFWPNLCATILGVCFGLPAAVYVNRHLTASQRRHDAAVEAMRRDDAIDVLVRACRWNEGRLDAMIALALEGRVMRNADLQVTTWDAVGPVLTPIFPHPELLQQLAHHWLRLRRLERLNEEVFAREVGTLPRLRDKEMMFGLWGELHESTVSLRAHARELADKLITLRGVSIHTGNSRWGSLQEWLLRRRPQR
jgi:hypothetical protein